ncbi:hypothetical protein MetMK1DRAFT_00022740 [Metallosphaera yellowstonensis MK1]|jgi:S-adenosylmethionine hydrolase|uniref:Uncharacterized protein n=1 Tax=Metallosphaera yellowstonensis MK1 TaxID=671065 RepID=H2C6T1_9CREN|nr:SAM-dependent chlorinase/fluorinase [Metallosphaera yellowstonensis]EHP69508.1 hypothetical protein MetMK1DRAFT_00022740 [Metallosphaera yellowstonensis MK1]
MVTIAILTDFGVSDNYNGTMEAVIRRLNPNVEFTYISGNAKNFNVISAAYLLLTSFRYFRKGTIFLTVVDPGVGTSRRALVIRTTRYTFVGPDNGVLYPAVSEDGIVEIREISNPRVYLSQRISNTFHGRDIFSVAAALLSLRVRPEVMGPSLSMEDLHKLNFHERYSNNSLCATVVHIDHFGNVALAKRVEDVTPRKRVKIKVGEREFEGTTARTFQDGGCNDLLVYENGYSFLEVGLNKGDASVVLGVKEGDEVCIEGFTQEDFSHST